MATPDAIAATTDALRRLLDREAALRGGPVPAVVAATPALLTATPSGATVWIWLHRVTPCAQRRVVPSRPSPAGRPRRPAVAVDLHYLVAAHASDAPMSQRLLGWAIRVLDDFPVLPAALLNEGGFTGCFRDDEAVEVVWETLTGQEESEIWQVAQTGRRPAAAYVARMVALESLRDLADAAIVEERELVFEGAVA